jgi:hypothetical protein
MASTLRMRAVVPAGESPYRVKGLVYQGLGEFFEERIAGGRSAVLAHASREDTTGTLGRFLGTRFAGGTWYDALPLVPLTEAAARVHGKTQPRVVRDAAAFIARRDLQGVYKALLSEPKPEAVAIRLPSLSLRYFEFGAADGGLIGPQTLVMRRSGVPEELARWFVWVVEGYVPTALAMAGAIDVRVSANDPKRDSGPGGATMQLEFRVAWT